MLFLSQRCTNNFTFKTFLGSSLHPKVLCQRNSIMQLVLIRPQRNHSLRFCPSAHAAGLQFCNTAIEEYSCMQYWILAAVRGKISAARIVAGGALGQNLPQALSCMKRFTASLRLVIRPMTRVTMDQRESFTKSHKCDQILGSQTPSAIHWMSNWKSIIVACGLKWPLR